MLSDPGGEAELGEVEPPSSDSGPATVPGPGLETPALPGASAEEAAVEPVPDPAGPPPAIPAQGRPVTSGGAGAGPAPTEPALGPEQGARPTSSQPVPSPPAPANTPSEEPQVDGAEEAPAEADPRPRPAAVRRLERALEERPELREAVDAAVTRSAPDQEVEAGLSLVFDVRPADAFALLDGTVVGRVREHDARSGRPFVLPGPGEYLLKLRSPGMEDHRILVRASASGPASTTVTARLTPAAAAELDLGDLPVVRVQNAVAFDVQPPTATIEVDGRRVGRADQYPGRFARPVTWLRLPPGRHRLSLTAPGFERRDFAVDVSAGARQERRKIEVRLEPVEGPS